VNLATYHKIIIEKYKNKEYKILKKKGLPKLTVSEDNYNLYAHDYLIYEWMLDHEDERWKELIEYILVPNGVNQKDCDVDFTQVDFQKFYTFLIELKNK